MHKTLYTIPKDCQVLMTLKLEIPILKPTDKPGAEEGGLPKAVSQHDLSQQGYKGRSWGMLWKKTLAR